MIEDGIAAAKAGNTGAENIRSQFLYIFFFSFQTHVSLHLGIRNGIPVRPNGHSVQTSPDGSLILNNVKPSDGGTYTCNAYTGIFSVSATAEVRVIKDTQQGGERGAHCRLLPTSLLLSYLSPSSHSK